MIQPNTSIAEARVDVPFHDTFAYLYVNPEFAKWDPWWQRFFEFLISLAPANPQWELEPVQYVYTLRAALSDEQRSNLAEFMREAPAHEIEGHRTLGRAARLRPEQVKRLQVMYFRPGPDRL